MMDQHHSQLTAAADIRYLTKVNTTFMQTEGRMLAANVEGEYYPSVFLHCSFPHTNRTEYISVRTAALDEIGMIRSLDEFPQDVVSLLEEYIKLRYFAPSITKIIEIKEEFGYSYWQAETTAGNSNFTVRRGGSHIQPVAENKLMITDVDGNRYMIDDVTGLTEKEYRMVEMTMG